MAVQTHTDVDHAIAFLHWYFGDSPDGLIYILRIRPARDEAGNLAKELERSTAAYSAPDRINTDWWRSNAEKWSLMFCTSPVATEKGNNTGKNCINVPALWFDLDGCKQLGIPGAEFYADIRNQEEVSCWTRSSENGIQGWFKLDAAYPLGGSKEEFDEVLQGVLWDICLYFGGDPAVNTIGRLMRLPGSLNIKREYEDPWLAKAKIYEDNIYTLSKLRKRFPTDPDTVPRLVAYSVKRAISPIWEAGERHAVMLRLAGSIRKGGINKEACKRLCNELQEYYHDEENRDADIETTYETSLDSLVTLKSDYKEVALEVDKAIEFWVALKKKYCKKKGIDFMPENLDPTRPPAEDGMFFEVNDETWYHGRETDEAFCNFTLRLTTRVIKADTNTVVWRAEIRKVGEVPTIIEISTEKHQSFLKFSTIAGLPPGISVLQHNMWSQYVKWLGDTPPEKSIRETPYYGVLDLDKKSPTMLIQKQPHPTYVWAMGSEDTAAEGAFDVELTTEEAQVYLRDFAKHYQRYHESQFIWPALGWFAACPISAWLFQILKGFPTMMVCGLAGTGKSNLVTRVLVSHYGAKRSYAFGSTTAFAIKRHLTSNNICPLVVDEFRDVREGKTVEVEAIIRSLWDKSGTGSGRSSGEVQKADYQAPLCLVGEHQYHEEATVHRTFNIRINRDWLRLVTDMRDRGDLGDSEAQTWIRRLETSMDWLQNSDHKGKLGTILVQWVREHFEDIPDIIALARKTIAKECHIRVERKLTGFAGVLAGYILLYRVYHDYGLKFPLPMKDMLQALFESDAAMKDHTSYDTDTIRSLFHATDKLITNGLRTKTPYENYVYCLDNRDSDTIYFDPSRWFDELQKEVRMTQSAALIERRAFMELIRDAQHNDNSPIVEFSGTHPIFASSCIKVDLRKVKSLFHINVNQWRDAGVYDA